MSEVKYPECEKLSKISEESNKIGDFLDWLIHEKEIIFSKLEPIECLECGKSIKVIECHKCGEENGLTILPQKFTIEEILAEYFEIDLNKLEKERRQILENIRKENE